MNQISILGCGWLGFPLAKALIIDGFTIKGSTTSANKVAFLKGDNIAAFLINLKENEAMGAITDFLDNSEILVIDIPPKLRGNNTESFVAKIENIIPFIEKSTIKKVLFVSSTTVYADQNQIVTEATIASPDSEAGKQLLLVESLLQQNKHFETTVLRFGGLIGEDRHPIKMLSGKIDIENPDAPVNLIHQQDCIGIIKKIIETQSWNEIFNAVHPLHPTRRDYYTQKAIEKNLTIPVFILNKQSQYKIISPNKIIKKLNYTFANTI
jgi:nucleoside-diphosphate-sugar epimerase